MGLLFFITYSVLLTIVLVYFIFKYIRLYNKSCSTEVDVTKLLGAIKRVRYGDINVRVENMADKDLCNAANRLFETMYDREMMIKEYQSTLSKKNITLEEMVEQEKQLRLFKEEFAATLTHDMKVPVIAELNSIDYLLDGRFGDLNEKQTEILKLMKSSNQELRDLIENMLETYRIEQKELKLNLKENDFNEFLISIINEMYPIAYNTSHKIVYNLDQTAGIIMLFDEFQLKRVIKNLIQNAITFSPASSDINISTECCGNKIKFNISNPGTNISKEDLDLIFHKYYSGNSKFRKAGTGLGLYLSQQIASAHHGNIEVDNNSDNITTFILTLPL